MFKPRQQNPTSDGTDVFANVIHPPVQVRLRVEATPGFHEIMRQGDASPAQVGSAVTDFYSSNIAHFIDKNRLQKAIGGQDQQWRSWSAPGINVNYRNNQGQETVEYEVFPERAPREAVRELFLLDLLLDGYAYITITTEKPIPVSTPGYWIEIGGTKYHLHFFTPLGADSGVPWQPFNFSLGLYDTDAYIVGTPGGVDHAQVFGDVTTINETDPFLWRTPDFVIHNGGYGFDPVPVPDSDETWSVFCNNQLVATMDLRFRDTAILNTLLLQFGKDAMVYRSSADQYQPPDVKLLNKVIPERSDHKLLHYYPLLPVSGSPVRNDEKIVVPDKILDKLGRNLFTTDCTRNLTFIAEWYDRKELRGVVQSPHDRPDPGGVLVITNDKPLSWGDGRFSKTEPVVVNFKNPDEFIGHGGGPS